MREGLIISLNIYPILTLQQIESNTRKKRAKSFFIISHSWCERGKKSMAYEATNAWFNLLPTQNGKMLIWKTCKLYFQKSSYNTWCWYVNSYWKCMYINLIQTCMLIRFVLMTSLHIKISSTHTHRNTKNFKMFHIKIFSQERNV